MQTHETLSSFRTVTQASNRKFGITFGLILLAAAIWPIFHGRFSLNAWLLATAVGLLAATWLKPGWLAPFNRGWFRLGLALNAVVSPIVMGMLFFGAVVPVGLVLRRNGKDLLQLKRQPDAETYWIQRDPAGSRAETFNKQF